MSVVAVSAIAMMAGPIAARAQVTSATSQPTKSWADPGSLERAKTQPATDQAPAPQTGTSRTEAPKAAEAGGKATSATDQKPNAVESDKLKELIRSAENSALEKKAKGRASARHPRLHSGTAKPAKEARKAAWKMSPEKLMKKTASGHIGYDALPNKKDAPAIAAPDAQFDPFSGYRQPISAAY
jgi:hypothetical protein